MSKGHLKPTKSKLASDNPHQTCFCCSLPHLSGWQLRPSRCSGQIGFDLRQIGFSLCFTSISNMSDNALGSNLKIHPRIQPLLHPLVKLPSLLPR